MKFSNDKDRSECISSAVILASGRGMRMGGPVPKQFLMLKEKPVLYYSLTAFDKAQSVDEIVIVASDRDFIENNILHTMELSKPVYFVSGGNERQDSVNNALEMLALSGAAGFVAIHDSARPLIRTEVIEQTFEEARRYGAAAAGMPVKDTVKITDGQGFAVDTPDRSRLWLIQTPQVFRFELLLEAHKKAQQDGFYGTDDSSLVERLGYKVRLVEGGYTNIKITTPDDIIAAEQILQRGEALK